MSDLACLGILLKPGYMQIHSYLVMATPNLKSPVADEEFLGCIRCFVYLWADTKKNYRLVS